MNKIIHVFMVGLIVYFTYHAFVGDRGLLSLFKLEDAIQSKEKELDKLVLERQELESKVTLFVIIFMVLFVFCSFVNFIGHLPVLIVVTLLISYYFYDK